MSTPASPDTSASLLLLDASPDISPKDEVGGEGGKSAACISDSDRHPIEPAGLEIPEPEDRCGSSRRKPNRLEGSEGGEGGEGGEGDEGGGAGGKGGGEGGKGGDSDKASQ